MYDIRVDAADHLVEVTLGDMMTVGEVDEYVAALRHAFVVNRLGSDYVLVLDVTHCPIQSQDMTRAMATHMATMPKARAIGVVTGGSLSRMQVRRLFTQPYARIVDTKEAARAWVLRGVDPDARAADTPGFCPGLLLASTHPKAGAIT